MCQDIQHSIHILPLNKNGFKHKLHATVCVFHLGRVPLRSTIQILSPVYHYTEITFAFMWGRLQGTETQIYTQSLITSTYTSTCAVSSIHLTYLFPSLPSFFILLPFTLRYHTKNPVPTPPAMHKAIMIMMATTIRAITQGGSPANKNRDPSWNIYSTVWDNIHVQVDKILNNLQTYSQKTHLNQWLKWVTLAYLQQKLETRSHRWCRLYTGNW